MVPDLTSAASFTTASPVARAAALLDGQDQAACRTDGGLLIAEGSVRRRQVRLAVTDRARAGGAFGVEEAAALQSLLERSAQDRMALVLVLDSAGARLDQGLSALGAFRRLFGAALKARLAGVPTIAVVAQDCFGGASMLAALCTRRLALRSARFGLSGPGIVEALAGKPELDASDPQAVAMLFGAPARLASGVFHGLCEDAAAALRAALETALADSAAPSPGLHVQHETLRKRLVAAGVAIPRERRAWRGFVNGDAVTARDCWLGADSLLTNGPAARLEIALDSPGQAATRLDESLALSEYVTHVSLCLAQHDGQVRLTITGEAAGAVYVALAAPAARVIARRTASVRLLPPSAVARVLGTDSADEGLPQALRAGVVDEIVGA